MDSDHEDQMIPFDVMDIGSPPTALAALAAAAESNGFDGLWTSETSHDPAVGLALAATNTTRIQLGTAVSIALARTPMTTALTAHDLQSTTSGRFTLGLGSQIATHITGRYSMPWDRPVARMREYVCAVRAIWESWTSGDRLDFRGDFYTHTVMTPFFSPGPHPFGPPPIHLAGFGPKMTEAAGEVADGFLTHPIATERYLREVTLPALRRGRAATGREHEPVELCVAVMVATGTNEEELAASVAAVRRQIAMYGTTPAYRDVLDRHGWGELGAELRRAARGGRWKSLADGIDDQIVRTIAVVAEAPELRSAVTARVGDIASRILLDSPGSEGAATWPVQ